MKDLFGTLFYIFFVGGAFLALFLFGLAIAAYLPFLVIIYLVIHAAWRIAGGNYNLGSMVKDDIRDMVDLIKTIF